MSFNPNRKAVFPTHGSYYWVCPPDVNYVDMVLIGAGGSGGGGGSGGTSVSHSGGAFGGGGGCAGGHGGSGILNKYQSVKVVPGQTYLVTVGAAAVSGGAGGIGSSNTSGGNGTAGAASSFAFPNGIVLKAAGGVAGIGGPHGGNASGSANGIGGSTNSPSTNLQIPGNDGQQSGVTAGGGTPVLSNAPLDSTGVQSYIYQIYTDISYTPVLAGQFTNFSPFGSGTGTPSFPSFATGNSVYDVGLNAAVSESGTNSGSGPVSQGGGAGGIVYQSLPMPLYLVGVDFSSLPTATIGPSSSGATLPTPVINVFFSTGTFTTSGIMLITNSSGVQAVSYTGISGNSITGCTGGTGTILSGDPVVNGISLPAIVSNEGTGLGNGGNAATNGSSPSASSFRFWVDGTATKIGFGAGGLGGPGAGGGGGGNSAGNFASVGGNGYHGDIGLGGLVMISW